MGSSKQTTQTSQRNDPWSPAIPALKQGLDAAGDVYNQRLTQSFFPGQTYAGFGQNSQAALTGMANKATDPNSLTSSAQNMMSQTLNGDFLSAGNPYFGAMSDRITQQVLPSITAQWARAGRGTGNTDVVRAASTGLGDSIGQLAYQNYAAERGNQMAAAQQAPGLDYANLDRLRAVGAEQDAMSQQGINEAMQRYAFDQNKQANALAEMQGFTLPVAQLGSQSEGTSTTTQKANPMQTALGLGLMGASMFAGGPAAMGAMGGMGGLGGLMGASGGMGGMGALYGGASTIPTLSLGSGFRL